MVRSVLIGGGLCAVVRGCSRAAGGRRGDDAHHELGTTPRPHAGAEQGVRPLTHIHVFQLPKPSYSRHDFPATTFPDVRARLRFCILCVSSFEPERLLGLLRRLVREPKAQDLGLGIAADLSERLVARVVRLHAHQLISGGTWEEWKREKWSGKRRLGLMCVLVCGARDVPGAWHLQHPGHERPGQPTKYLHSRGEEGRGAPDSILVRCKCNGGACVYWKSRKKLGCYPC